MAKKKRQKSGASQSPASHSGGPYGSREEAGHGSSSYGGSEPGTEGPGASSYAERAYEDADGTPPEDKTGAAKPKKKTAKR